MFLAEGPQAVKEAFASGLVTELFVTAPARARHGKLVDAVAAAKVSVHEIGGELMAELAQTVTPQGLLAICPFVDVPLASLVTASARGVPGGRPPEPAPRGVPGGRPPEPAPRGVPGGRPPEAAPRLVVVLANVRDPGNAGTVLRTADAAGADGVIFADASVDPYNSKCVRSSAGSLFHLPIVTGVSLAAAAAELRGAGLAVLAADGGASLSLDQLDGAGRLGKATAWVFGNEAWGLPSELVALADEAVAVPIYGRAESLNLAAAAAVCLYASARAHAQGVPPRSPDTIGSGYVAS